MLSLPALLNEATDSVSVLFDIPYLSAFKQALGGAFTIFLFSAAKDLCGSCKANDNNEESDDYSSASSLGK